MKNSRIKEIFANAATLDKSRKGQLTEQEWLDKLSLNGAKIFKRTVLGLCGIERIVTLDQMANLLHDAHVAPSVEAGRELIPHLVGKDVFYSDSSITGPSYMAFDEVKSSTGVKAYRITKYSIDID